MHPDIGAIQLECGPPSSDHTPVEKWLLSEWWSLVSSALHQGLTEAAFSDSTPPLLLTLQVDSWHSLHLMLPGCFYDRVSFHLPNTPDIRMVSVEQLKKLRLKGSYLFFSEIIAVLSNKSQLFLLTFFLKIYFMCLSVLLAC